MSGLYNLIAGRHPAAPVLLTALGFKDDGAVSLIPRMRDVYLYPEEIRILTRTGGGNRDEYAVDNDWLRSLTGFLRDWDDEYDSTYAWWAYSWPDDWRPQLQHLLETIQEDAPELMPKSLKQPFEAAIERIKKEGPDADTDETDR
jgi:hypothetical protein